MEDGRIANYQVTASSAWRNYTRAYFGRLNGEPIRGTSNGVWTPSTHNDRQWIEVNFGIPRLLTGVMTQGRPGDNHWVTRYKVQYSNDSINWQYVVDSQQNDTVNLYHFNCLMNIALISIY